VYQDVLWLPTQTTQILFLEISLVQVMAITIPIRLPSARRIDNMVFGDVSVGKTIVVHVFSG